MRGNAKWPYVPEHRECQIAVPTSLKKELLAHLSAGLIAKSAPTQHTGSARKVHICLQCAGRGALYLIDEMVEDAARMLNADLVRLDSLDLQELFEDVLEPSLDEIGLAIPPLALANIVRGEAKGIGRKEESPLDEEQDHFDEDEASEDSANVRLAPGIPFRLLRFFASRPIFNPLANLNGLPDFSLNLGGTISREAQKRMSKYLTAIVSAPEAKRKEAIEKSLSCTEVEETEHALARPRTILYLRGFQSLLDSPLGQNIHQNVLKVVATRRRFGDNVLLVVSSGLPSETMTMTLLDSHYHSLKIPVPINECEKSTLRADYLARVREINLRNLQITFRQRCDSRFLEFECPPAIHLDRRATAHIRDLSQDIWHMNHVQRIASVAIGNCAKQFASDNRPTRRRLTIADIAEASEDIALTDQCFSETVHSKKMEEGRSQHKKELEDPKLDHRLNPLNTKEYNKHEQRLLGGVIDPGRSICILANMR
jgi:hypothetical protein